MKENTNIKYAAAITLGCRLNQTDTAIIFEELQKVGYTIVKPDSGLPLSVVVINTCSVTSSASQKSRQSARSIRTNHPEALIIVTGCSAETDRNWKNEPAIDIVIPNKDKTKIADFLRNQLKMENEKRKMTDGSNTPNQKSDRTILEVGSSMLDVRSSSSETFTESSVGFFPFKQRANIKIQDGCDAFCTYCIVPYGRGRPRSREWNNTISEFRELVKRGYREIVLTGVNIATYNDNSRNLIDLLKEFLSTEGDFRIRLGSTEPQFSMQGLIDIIASSDKICRFLHLPLQHGSEEVLKRMGRSYFTGAFRDFVFEAVSKIPDICIGSDIIVGFPGESDKNFSDCREFIESLPLAYLHVFKYSKRPGTPAATYKDQIHPKIASERHMLLTDSANRLSYEFMKKQIGKIVKVLFEEEKNGYLTGLTDNYIRVNVMKNVKCQMSNEGPTADHRPQAADSIQNPAYRNGSSISAVNFQQSISGTGYSSFIPVKLTAILKNRSMTGKIC